MYRIILADDEEYVRELLSKNINQSMEGFQVVAKAADGREAVRLVKEYKPDILVTDICMPFVSGLELIRQLQELEHPVKTVIISGYDDFSYAKQALTLGVTDYLLKPFSPDELYEVLNKIRTELERQKTLMNNIQEMKEQLKDSRQIVQEQVVRKLIQRIMRPEIIQKEAEAAGICLEVPYCAVGILRIRQNIQEQERDIKDLLSMTKDTYFPQSCQIYITRFHAKQIVILFLGDYRNVQSFRRVVRDGLVSIEESMERYYDFKAECIIGGIYEEWTHIPDSYKDALSVWRGTLENPDPVLFFGDQDANGEGGHKGQFERPRELEQQLLIHIQMGQEEKAEECLYDILQYYERMDVKLGDFVRISLVELVFDISSTLLKAGGQGQVWEDEDVVEYLKEHFAYGSLRDAKEVLCSYIIKCCRRFASVNESQGERIVFQVKELIEKNIDNEEFGLEEASGKLYFSHNYIRQIFKQITGESFMEYLIRRRMETARELLKNGTLKIQDVAVKTGYSNQRYFASCFKKYYGCTPTEYRNQLEGET